MNGFIGSSMWNWQSILKMIHYFFGGMLVCLFFNPILFMCACCTFSFHTSCCISWSIFIYGLDFQNSWFILQFNSTILSAPCHCSKEVMSVLEELQEKNILYVIFIPRTITKYFQVYVYHCIDFYQYLHSLYSFVMCLHDIEWMLLNKEC